MPSQLISVVKAALLKNCRSQDSILEISLRVRSTCDYRTRHTHRGWPPFDRHSSWWHPWGFARFARSIWRCMAGSEIKIVSLLWLQLLKLSWNLFGTWSTFTTPFTITLGERNTFVYDQAGIRFFYHFITGRGHQIKRWSRMDIKGIFELFRWPLLTEQMPPLPYELTKVILIAPFTCYDQKEKKGPSGKLQWAQIQVRCRFCKEWSNKKLQNAFNRHPWLDSHNVAEGEDEGGEEDLSVENARGENRGKTPIPYLHDWRRTFFQVINWRRLMKLGPRLLF